MMMKKRIFLILSMLVAVTFLVVGMTISASAAGEVATIEGKGSYISLSDAVSAADDGDVIDVSADTTVSSVITISNKTIEITSSNGSTIACSVNNAFTVGSNATDAGSLTFSGNLNVTNTGNQTVQMVNGSFTLKDTVFLSGVQDTVNAGGAALANKAEIHILGGTVKCTTTTADKGAIWAGADGVKIYISGGTIDATANPSVNESAIRFASKNGVLEISGGELKGTNGAVAITSNAANAKVTMTGGTLSATKQAGIWNKAANATIEVSGGTITTPMYAILFEGSKAEGTVNISGTAEITATTKHAITATNDTQMTVNISGGTISAPEKTLYYWSGAKTSKVTVTGGCIVSEGNTAVWSKGPNADIRISGGKVEAGSYAVLFEGGSATGTLNVTGGEIYSKGNFAIYMTGGDATVNVSGGTVKADGNRTIFRAGTNVGNVTFNLSGGTISAGSSENGGALVDNTGSKKGTWNISGTVVITAPAKAIALFSPAAKEVNITGGTVETTSTETGDTVYVETTATGNVTITISGGTLSAAGDFVLHPRHGSVNISGGTLTSAGYLCYLQGDPTVTVSGGTMTAGKNAVFAFSGPATLDISGGTMILKGGSATHKIIADVLGAGSECKVSISGGVFVDNNQVGVSIIDPCGSGTLSITGGKFLYRKELKNIVPSRFNAPKDVQTTYDLNGNGEIDDGETFYLSVFFAGAEKQYAGVMEKGAAVRMWAGGNGMRFTANFSADVVNALKALGEVSYGTLILPTASLVGVDAFTKAALDAGAIEYRDIPAADGLIDNGDGSLTVLAVLTEIAEEDYGTAFCAIFYAKVGDTYYYTAFNSDQNSRTVCQVAQAALDDLKNTKKDEYRYTVEVALVDLYTPYKEAQRVVLEGYLAGMKKEQTGGQETQKNMIFDKENGTISLLDDEKLRILQLTDMQIIDASQRRSPGRITAQAVIDWDPSMVEKNCYSHIRDLIVQTDPHLILLTGDLVYGEFDDNGSIFRDFVTFMDSFGIPWAPVWGNHDLESAVGSEKMCQLLEAANNCFFRTETQDIADGTGNYAVKIYRGNTLLEMVYLLDSHGCSHAYEDAVRAVPKSITENQLLMIEKKAKEASEEAGHTVPGIAAWHIPTADFFEAFEALGYPNEIGTVIGGTVNAHPGDFGAIFEQASPPATRPDDFAERLVTCGINGVFNGHHHNINTSVTWKGIRWTMGLKCGTYDYYLNGAIGGTLIEIENGVPTVRHIPVLFGY